MGKSNIEIWPIPGIGGGVSGAPASVAIDSYTLHQWKLSDAGNAFVDTGTDPVTLTAAGAGVCTHSLVGQYSDCAGFDGASYLKSANDVGRITQSSFSISFWMTLINAGSFPRLIGKCFDPTPTNTSFELVMNGNNIFAQWTDNGGAKNSNTGTNGIIYSVNAPVNPVHHIAATMEWAANAYTVKFYIDGIMTSSESVASTLVNWNVGASGPWIIVGNSSAYAAGKFFDARVDNGIARSAAYWKTMYKMGTGRNY